MEIEYTAEIEFFLNGKGYIPSYEDNGKPKHPSFRAIETICRNQLATVRYHVN